MEVTFWQVLGVLNASNIIEGVGKQLARQRQASTGIFRGGLPGGSLHSIFLERKTRCARWSVAAGVHGDRGNHGHNSISNAMGPVQAAGCMPKHGKREQAEVEAICMDGNLSAVLAGLFWPGQIGLKNYLAAKD